jgi:hypothetical protein
MSGPRIIEFTGPLTCPACGHEVPGRWPGDQETAAHQCGACGHVFDAAWPGFPMEPQTVIIEHSAGEEPGRVA